MTKQFQVDTGGTLTTNLVAYYKLEDANDFWNSFDLTNVGSVAFNPGKIGNAADLGLQGDTKYLYINDNLGIAGGNCSISLWFNETVFWNNVAKELAQQVNNSVDVEYAIAYSSVGAPHVVFRRGRVGQVNVDLNINATLTPGTWYHLVLTYDGVNIKGWINGISQGTIAASGNGSWSCADKFCIGQDWAIESFNVSGLIDEVGVWSKKLSNQEIADLYNGSSGQTMEETGAGTTRNKFLSRDHIKRMQFFKTLKLK